MSCWYSLSCRRHFYFTGKYSAHMCTDLSQCVCTLTEDSSSVSSQASCPILLWYIAQGTLIRNTFRIEAARLQEANVSIFGVQPWTWVQPFWWVRSRFLASFSNICWKLKKKGISCNRFAYRFSFPLYLQLWPLCTLVNYLDCVGSMILNITGE